MIHLLIQIIKSLIKASGRWVKDEVVLMHLKKSGISLSRPFVVIGHQNISSEKNVHIQAFTTLWCGADENQSFGPGKIQFGNRIYVGESCNLRAAGYSIKIGSNVLIANNVTMVSSNHGILRGKLIMDQDWDSLSGDIEIGDDVWIGAGAIILPGVKIGRGSVIGAGSVVTRHIDENSIACGTPARVIKKRS